MNKIKNYKTQLSDWLYDTKAAAAIEYALMITAIALAIAVSVFAFGEDLAAFYGSLYDLITG